jgi:hypothetical protein
VIVDAKVAQIVQRNAPSTPESANADAQKNEQVVRVQVPYEEHRSPRSDSVDETARPRSRKSIATDDGYVGGKPTPDGVKYALFRGEENALRSWPQEYLRHRSFGAEVPVFIARVPLEVGDKLRKCRAIQFLIS